VGSRPRRAPLTARGGPHCWGQQKQKRPGKCQVVPVRRASRATGGGGRREGGRRKELLPQQQPGPPSRPEARPADGRERPVWRQPRERKKSARVALLTLLRSWAQHGPGQNRCGGQQLTSPEGCSLGRPTSGRFLEGRASQKGRRLSRARRCRGARASKKTGALGRATRGARDCHDDHWSSPCNSYPKPRATRTMVEPLRDQPATAKRWTNPPRGYRNWLAKVGKPAHRLAEIDRQAPNSASGTYLWKGCPIRSDCAHSCHP